MSYKPGSLELLNEMHLLGPKDDAPEGEDTTSWDGLDDNVKSKVESPSGTASVKVSPKVSQGQDFGRYHLLEQLGAGGMGVVHAAYDSILGRRVAIKFLRYDSNGSTGVSHSSTAQRRLFREAQSLAKLTHPNIVTVFDVGQLGAEVYLAMELVDGCSLSRWLNQGRKSWREVVTVMRQVACGLAAAHDMNLVHRDVKPENILLDRENHVFIVDFGLVREGKNSTESSEHVVSHTECHFGHDHDQENLTRHGSLVGTPAYMAPEQHDRKPVDSRSDQYSFCVTLYEALFAKRLFEDRDERTIRQAKSESELRVASKIGISVPLWLRNVLSRGLSVDPEKRYPTMYALIDALDQGVARDKQRRFFFGVVAFALSAAALITWIEPSEKELCNTGANSVAGTWDTARTAEIRRGFIGSGESYAQSSWANAHGKLQEYINSWLDAREQVCLMYRSDEVKVESLLDSKIACSNRQISQFRSLTEQFEHADSSTVRRAMQAVIDLPNPIDCVEVSEMSDLRPQPKTNDLRNKVEAQRVLLGKAAVMQDTGHYAEAASLCLSIAQTAEELGFRPLAAETYLRLGIIYREQMRSNLSIEVLTRSIETAVAGGDDSTAAEAAAALIFVQGYLAGDLAAYGGLVSQAESMIRRVGNTDKLMSLFYSARSAVEVMRWKTVEGMEFARLGLEAAERAFGPEHPYTVMALHDFAINQVQSSNFSEGRRLMEQVIEIQSRNLGGEHPDVIRSRDNLAGILIIHGRVREALERYQQNIEVEERVFANDNLRSTLAYGGRAQAYLWSAQPYRALEDFRRNLDTLERSGEQNGLRLYNIRLEIADLLEQLGDREQSRQTMQQAIADIRKHKHKLDAVSKFYVDFNIVQAFLNRGKRLIAEEYFTRSVEILEGMPEWPSAIKIDVFLLKSNLAIEERDFELALRYQLEAIPLIKADIGEDNFRMVSVLYGLCYLQRLTGRWTDAESTVLKAIDMVESELGVRSGALTAVLLELGRVYLATGRSNQARAVLDRARRVYDPEENWPIHRADLDFAEAKLLALDPSFRQKAVKLAQQALVAYDAAGPMFAIGREEIEDWISSKKAA